jgi:PST family polysaccharide transporter
MATASGLGVWGLLLGYYAAEVTDGVLSWALVGWRPQLRAASIAMWRELIRYGRYIVATSALERAQEQIPVVLLGRFVGAPSLGQLRYAIRMEATSGSVVVQAGSYVLFPALARIAPNRERFREACMRSLRIMCAIGFPLGLMLLPLGVPAAVILFGDVWRQAGYAAMALVGMPTAGTLISFASETVKAAGRPELLTRIRGVIVVVATVFMVMLLPFGLIGVAAGLSLGTVVGATYAMIRIRRLLDISGRDMLAEIAPPAIAAIVMVAVLIPVEFLIINASAHGTAYGMAFLSAEFSLGTAIYMSSLWLIAPATLEELMSVVPLVFGRR